MKLPKFLRAIKTVIFGAPAVENEQVEFDLTPAIEFEECMVQFWSDTSRRLALLEASGESDPDLLDDIDFVTGAGTDLPLGVIGDE